MVKRLVFFVLQNPKRLNRLCLFFCLLPLPAGLCLWHWLPQTLICWETTAAAMSGTVTKAGGVLLFPLMMAAFEGLIIALTFKLHDPLVPFAVKAVLPVFTVCTSAVSYCTGLLGNWLPVAGAYLAFGGLGAAACWRFGYQRPKGGI